MKNRPLEPSKTFLGREGEAGRSVGVSCRDFVPPEKAWPFQVVQAGGIVENPRAFGRMPPTMHESTKHPQRGRRTVSIDRFPKINGSGIPDSSPFHKKCVARPQKKFSDRPLFQKGSPGAGRGPCKERWVVEQEPCKENWVQGGKPCENNPKALYSHLWSLITWPS